MGPVTVFVARAYPRRVVRQNVIRFLIEERSANQSFIAQEVQVVIEGMAQRADVVVYDAAAKPCLLVECKAPEVPIDQQTLDQAVRYNAVLGARYVLLTNGLKHYCYKRDSMSYSVLQQIPDLKNI